MMTNTMRCSTCGRALGMHLRRHGASRSIGSIERRAAPAASFVRAPACLAREDGVVEAVKRARTCTVDKGRVAKKGNVVEAKVPDRGVDHAV